MCVLLYVKILIILIITQWFTTRCLPQAELMFIVIPTCVHVVAQCIHPSIMGAQGPITAPLVARLAYIVENFSEKMRKLPS